MVRDLLTKLGTGPWGPIRLALALAVPTLPIVAWAIANPTLAGSFAGRSFGLVRVLPIAVVALIAASVAAGFVGGRLVRRPMLAIFATMAIAWFIGMASIPIAASVLGIDYVGAALCIDGCQPLVADTNPLSGAMAWGLGTAMSIGTIVPPIFAVVLLVIGRRLMRRGGLVRASVLVVAATAALQWIDFASSGLPAIVVYLCLGIGVVVWASILVPAPVPEPATVTIEPAPAPLVV